MRVSLANGVTVEKALAKLKAAANKKARQEQKDRWEETERAECCLRIRPRARTHSYVWKRFEVFVRR